MSWIISHAISAVKSETPQLGAAAVSAAIAGAPVAGADPDQTNQTQESCTNPEASSTVCQGPGDVEITDTPPPRTFYPYGSPPPTAG
jgi:hypothetical protein